MSFWESQGVGEYFGIDLSERAINCLKQRFPQHRFMQRDLNDPGLPASVGTGYDCVTAIDVLYHVTDDERFRAVMCELGSLLKPGGVIIIHDQFLHGPAYDHGQYIRWRSLAEYEDALKGAGFEVLYRRPTFFFMIQAVDFSGLAAKFMTTLWNHFSYPVICRFPRFAGAIGYVVDSAICSTLHEGPSMEIMVCRKRAENMQ
jgi:SAM-dependent methyltransferase